jgi:competence protein ComEA
MPASWRRQPHLGSAQVGLVAMVVAAGLVLGAWWLVQGRGAPVDPVAVRPPEVVAEPDAAAEPSASTGSGAPTVTGPISAVPASAGPSDSPGDGAAQQIVVDVVGRVRRPGIAVLPAGARVIDAVEAAGGLRRGFPAATVNMARVLTDGEQVLIRRGSVPSGSTVPGGPLPAPAASGAPAALVNLNTADQAALESLPGVGPVTATAILEWRAEHGAFSSVDELLEVSGIGDATLAEIAPHVTL